MTMVINRFLVHLQESSYTYTTSANSYIIIDNNSNLSSIAYRNKTSYLRGDIIFTRLDLLSNWQLKNYNEIFKSLTSSSVLRNLRLKDLHRVYVGKNFIYDEERNKVLLNVLTNLEYIRYLNTQRESGDHNLMLIPPDSVRKNVVLVVDSDFLNGTTPGYKKLYKQVYKNLIVNLLPYIDMRISAKADSLMRQTDLIIPEDNSIDGLESAINKTKTLILNG